MEREQQEQEQRRLYLILDDNPYGYSIREISLSPPPSSSSRDPTRSSYSSPRKKTKNNNTTAASSGGVPVRSLPEPIISVESKRGLPKHFAAVGTRILFTQCLNDYYSLDGHVVMPVVDVPTKCVTFGRPSGDTAIIAYPVLMSLPVAGGELFVRGPLALSKLSFNPHWPPPLDDRSRRIDDDTGPWAWHQLPSSLFEMAHLTSYAVDADGQTVVFSADSYFCAHTDDPYDDADDPPATFAFDTRASVWERRGDWALPFAGRAFFVRCLGALVGLSKDPATSGHLVSCEPPLAADTGPPDTWKLGKEKMFSDDPAETHVSATLVYTGATTGGGGGSEFCLVQCVSVKHGSNNGNNSDHHHQKKLDEEEPRRSGYGLPLSSDDLLCQL